MGFPPLPPFVHDSHKSLERPTQLPLNCCYNCSACASYHSLPRLSPRGQVAIVFSRCWWSGIGEFGWMWLQWGSRKRGRGRQRQGQAEAVGRGKPWPGLAKCRPQINLQRKLQNWKLCCNYSILTFFPLTRIYGANPDEQWQQIQPNSDPVGSAPSPRTTCAHNLNA